MCGYIPDMKVTEEKLYMLGYPLELIIKKWQFGIFSISKCGEFG